MDCDRRSFLGKSLQGISKVALASPAICLLASCGKNPSSNAPPATPVANSASGIYTLDFTDFPALQNVGGTVHISVAATSGTKDLFVTTISSSVAEAVSTVCTHQGCELNAYNASTQQYSCPCHGSVFNQTGDVVNGPATTALQAFSGTVGASAVTITIP